MATEHAPHTIEIVPAAAPVRIELDGELLAESSRALALHETGLRVRYYLPREDVVADLRPSETHTVCPFKGQASYHVVVAGGREHPDLVWFYPDPIPQVEPIRDLVCFYDERVELYVGGERAA